MMGDDKIEVPPFSEKPPYPSRSLRPGTPERALALILADPGVWIVRIVIGIFAGITKAILEHREKKQAERVQSAEREPTIKTERKKHKPKK